MNKKAIAILGAIFILIVGTLGFLIYSKYGSKKTSTSTSNNTSPPVETVDTGNNNGTDQGSNNASTTPPETLSQRFVKLTDEQVVSPVLFYNGSAITYLNKQGGVFQADLQESNGVLQLENKRQLENIPPKQNISKILWPSRGNDFIAEFKSFGKKTWSYYNNNTVSFTDYPPQIISVDWMPSGDKIIYVWLENGKATLNLADPDTKNWVEVSEMWEQDDSIHMSPDGLSVLYFRTENTEASNAINLTTPDGKLWRGLVKEGYNFGVLWSPDSQKFLFNKKDRVTQKYQLWVYDVLAGDVKNLGMFTTVEKAVWDKDGKTIYAAVPKTSSTAAEDGGLTEDGFYKIDVENLEKKEYAADGEKIDGQNLFLSLSGDKLFFRNA
ncbi:MAG: hypothetical protein NTX98_01070, partial [Candidatus Doudnabacteria bacterium]|nr:hypothetical protein [Candidatus Doudnabacteria bacterium]